MKCLPNWGRWTPTKRLRELPPHQNAGFEIVYVVRGEIEWVYDGATVRTHPGSVVVSWPWEVHGIRDGALPQCELIWLLFEMGRLYHKPSNFPRFHSGFQIERPLERAVATAFCSGGNRIRSASPLCAELIRSIIAEQEGPSSHHLSRVRGMVSLLLQELIVMPQPTARKPEKSDARDRVASFIREIERRCAEEWTLERMSQACQLSRTRFAMITSQLTGDTPLRLLARCRIHMAQQLLAQGKYSITTVGFECGFESSQYFARVFRDFTGQSPSQWQATSRA